MNKRLVNVTPNFTGEGFILDYLEPFVSFSPRKKGNDAIKIHERRVAVYCSLPTFSSVEVCRRHHKDILLLALLEKFPECTVVDGGTTDADADFIDYNYQDVDELRVFIGNKFIGYILLTDITRLLQHGTNACSHDPVDPASASQVKVI